MFAPAPPESEPEPEPEPLTALGTVASVLPLAETDLVAATPFFGEVHDGPEMATVRRWSLWDDGALLVIAWHDFQPAEDMEARNAVEVATGPVRAWRWPTRERLLANELLLGPHGSAHVSRPLVQRATVVAAAAGGTSMTLALACRPDDEVCLREDLAGPIDALARSLRPGAPLGGGTWTVRVPDGPAHDALLTMALPVDLVGLPLRHASAGRWQAIVVSLRDGSIVLRLAMGPPDWSGPEGTTVACAPYQCAWHASEAIAADAPALFAGVRREVVPAQEMVPLIEGRIGLLAGGPVEHDAADEMWGAGPTAVHRSLVRVPLSGSTAAVVTIHALDSLQTIDWPPTWPIDAGVGSLRAADVRELPSSDAAWSVFARDETEDDELTLFALEHGGTAIELRVDFPQPVDDAERELAARTIAAGLRRLGPTRTTERWRVRLGALAIDVTLPPRFATTFDEVLYEGWSAASAVYLGQPRSQLLFTRGERLPRRRPRLRRTIAMDGLELELRAHTPESSEWVAEVPCGCRFECTVEVRGDEAQREALIAALAAAHVEPRIGTVEDVQVRSGPSDDADAIGRIWPSREVFVRQTRGEWLEIEGRDSSSRVALRGWVRARSLGEYCN